LLDSMAPGKCLSISIYPLAEQKKKKKKNSVHDVSARPARERPALGVCLPLLFPPIIQSLTRPVCRFLV
jgi:hypothetical protein